MQRQWRLYLPVLSLVLLVVFASTPNARVKADDDNDYGSPVGTWILKAMLDTPPGSPPFVVTNLVAINPGGTFTLTDNVFNAHASGNPFLPPPFVVDDSDGYGSWERRRSNQFATIFKRFLFAGAKTDPAIYGSFFVGLRQ